MALSKMSIIVWNVKRGNAISLHLPNGKTVMIDCGNSDECSPVKKLNRDLKIEKIDWLVVTHPHTDHMADIEMIQKLGMNPTVLTTALGISETAIKSGNMDQASVARYISFKQMYNAQIDNCNNPYDRNNMGGVQFKCFAPIKCVESDLNNRSLVILAEYGGTKVLFMGDCTNAAQRELLKYPEFVKAIKGVNILVVPHHGHESCYCPELMELINPRVCIVSDGKDTQEVSAVPKYGEHSSGITFWNCGRGRDKRVCLTTRRDGHIVIDVPCCGGVRIRTTESGLEQC